MNNQEERGVELSKGYDQVDEQVDEQVDCELERPMDRRLSEGEPQIEVEDKIREINIRELNRGYIVSVGCHNFAISTKAELTAKLTEYINEPSKTEKLWFSGDLF